MLGFHVEDGFGERIRTITSICDQADAYDLKVVLILPRIEDVVEFGIADIPIPLIASRGRYGNIGNIHHAEQGSVEWAFYSDDPRVPLKIPPACIDVSACIDEEIVISEDPKQIACQIDGIPFPDASEIEILILSEDHFIPLDMDTLKVKIDFPLRLDEFSGLEILAVSFGGYIGERIEQAFGRSRYLSGFLDEIEEPGRHLPSFIGIQQR